MELTPKTYQLSTDSRGRYFSGFTPQDLQFAKANSKCKDLNLVDYNEEKDSFVYTNVLLVPIVNSIKTLYNYNIDNQKIIKHLTYEVKHLTCEVKKLKKKNKIFKKLLKK